MSEIVHTHSDAPSPKRQRALDTVFMILAGVAVLSVAANAWLANRNAGLALQVAQGQRVINEGLRLSQTNAQVVRLIAQLSATQDDIELRTLLARYGIQFRHVNDTGDIGAGNSSGEADDA